MNETWTVQEERLTDGSVAYNAVAHDGEHRVVLGMVGMIEAYETVDALNKACVFVVIQRNN